MPTNKILSAKVNQHFSFDGADLEAIDFLPINDRQFHILYDNKSYHATLIDAQQESKQFIIKINGSQYAIQLSDQYDQLIEQLGLNAVVKHTALDIKAPMPGLVLEVLVKEGQEVAEGDPILILEAMKMENVLKAAAPGLIDAINIKQGTAVEKGQLLVACSKL